MLRRWWVPLLVLLAVAACSKKDVGPEVRAYFAATDPAVTELLEVQKDYEHLNQQVMQRMERTNITAELAVRLANDLEPALNQIRARFDGARNLMKEAPAAPEEIASYEKAVNNLFDLYGKNLGTYDELVQEMKKGNAADREAIARKHRDMQTYMGAAVSSLQSMQTQRKTLDEKYPAR